MPHMLLILEPPEQRAGRSLAEGQQAYASMVAWGQQLQQRGLLAASESLTSHADATRVSVREGKPRLIDGPFAEAKEMVGGFFLLNTEDRGLALELAAQCPAAAWATVEVRALGPCFAGSGLAGG